MGKEWKYYLGGGNSSRSTKRGKTSSGEGVRDSSSSTTSGCMNAIFQLFDLHQFHFSNLDHHHQSSSSFNPPPDSFLPEEPPIYVKGVEAPRNSLEIGREAAATLSSSSTLKKEEALNIQMGGIQIKTSGHTRSSITDHDLSSSEYSSSSPAGTKTPTLVAKLMGLDLLPETSSPRPSSSSSSTLSSSKSHLHHQQVQNCSRNNKKTFFSSDNNDAVSGSRSLSETPRTSSARRSDVDQRFSLQEHYINKNEICNTQEIEFSKFLTTKIAAAATARRTDDENMSPGQCAKQIVKQFKESVSRRVGRDITNTVESRSDQRRDQNVVLLKSKKPSSSSSNIGDNSCSPRLRFLEIKNKISHSPKLSTSPLSPCTNNQSECVTVSSKPKPQAVPLKEEEQQTQQSSILKCRKIAGEKYGPRLKKPPQTSDFIRSKQEESFVKSSSPTTSRAKANHLSDKKCKKTPLSNVPTILSVKKDRPPPATRSTQQQEGQKQYQRSHASASSKNSTQLSSCLSQTNKQAERHTVTDVNDSNNSTGTTASTRSTTGAELMEYISTILKCTGIQEYTPVSFTKWYSPSYPLDLSKFLQIQISFPKLEELIGGKLVFELVDELLVDILRPYVNLKPWVSWIIRNGCHARILYGWQLINTLYTRIRSFPLADCRVLEDIDALIDNDLCGRERSAFEEEGDDIVKEIEGDILDNLVHELVAMVVFGVRTE